MPMEVGGATGCEESTGTERRSKLQTSSRNRDEESNRKQIHSQVKHTQSEDCMECATAQRPWKLLE